MIIGTVANAAAIVAGGLIGVTLAKLSKDKSGSGSGVSDSVLKVIGLAVLIMGVHMTLKEHDYFPVVVCLALGTFLGEMLRIESRIEQFGGWLQKITKSKSDTFVSGFVFASVLFGVGAMAIIGALNDGLLDDPALLFTKSLLDGITSIILAVTMGIGVAFSAIPIFILQGGISLGASQLTFLLENPVYINGISVTGGVMIVAIGLNLLGVAKLRIGNMLPAIVLIPVYDAIYLAVKGL